MLLTTYRTAALAIAALLCLLAMYALGRSDGADLVQGRWDKSALKAAQTYDEEVDRITKERDALAGVLAASNDKHLKEKQNAQDETNHIRDRVATGAGGLRIPASCPGQPAPPQASAGPELDTRTGAELGAVARRAYFALRDGIDRATAQLAACQDELKLRQ